MQILMTILPPRMLAISTISLLVVLATAPWSLAEMNINSHSSRMPLLMPDDFESLKLAAWRVEEGVQDPNNPLLEPEMPWDSGGIMAHGTVLHDPIDGLWKAWQVSTPAEETFNDLEAKHEEFRRLTYLESKDGVTWYRPKLPFVKWPGFDETNIIFDLDSGGTAVYASVLVDPTNEAWPYEMFVLRTPVFGPDPTHVGHLPAPEEKRATYRYQSKDGKDWKLVEGPIHPSRGGGADVSYVYKLNDGGYVSYFKNYPPLKDGGRIITYDNNPRGGLRSIARRTSEDGTHWGDEKTVLERDWRDPDFAQFLELTPVQVDGGFIGVLTYYNSSIQTMSLQMAASRDGIHWWRPDRRPTLPNPPLGDYGSGMIWQMHHPIIEGHKMHVYYAGSEGLHGEIFDSRFEPRIEVGGESVIGFQTPTLPFNTALQRASWDFDRLWALVPSAGGVTLGEAVTKQQTPGGRKLAVNAFVRKGGSLRVELLDSNNAPIPGFEISDSEPLEGDHRHRVLKWKGGEAAPANAVKIRFVLHRAFLYGFDWTD